MTLLKLPEPYDFELSTERFRAFGPDLANLWHEGGVHRVVDGREFRIEAAPGGVDVEPLDAETEPVAQALVGAVFELDPFYAWAKGDQVLRELVPSSPASPAAGARSLRGDRQRDQRATGLPVLGVCRPQPDGRALRRPRGHASSFRQWSGWPGRARKS